MEKYGGRNIEKIRDLPKEHEEIIVSIEKGDIQAARDVINHHIDSVGRYGNEMKKKYPEFFV